MDPYFAGQIKMIVQYYEDFMQNKGNPRMKNFPLMDNPLPTLIICLVYIHFCKVISPKLMRNRKPLELRYFKVFYNIAQMMLNGWIFNEYLQSGWLGQNNLHCQPLDCNIGPTAQRLANTCWLYFISKFIEMFDTVIFLLTKKHNHVSDMHIIHHGLMPISVWAGLKFAPGNHSTLFALVNSFVHVVMYFYNMLIAIGPKNKYFQAGRKYLTGLQILQFVIVLGHQLQFAFSECSYSKGFLLWIGLHGLLIFLLFSDFYYKKYDFGMQKLSSPSKEYLGPSKKECLATSNKEKKPTACNVVRTFRIWERKERIHPQRTQNTPFTLVEDLETSDKEE